jgi:uncharacterized iron-regulated membrane protein
MKPILILHRYLGVAVGLLMALWCLSGFVMMIQAYPSLGQEERLKGLEPLNLAGCCDFSKYQFADDVRIGGFRVEMLSGRPVIRFAGEQARGAQAQRGDTGPRGLYDLRTGEPVEPLTEAQALMVAQRFAAGNGIAGSAVSLGEIDIDQWTIQSARRNRPVFHFDYGDRAGTEVYVSGATGELFQKTTAKSRFLAWIGVIPHWLYPTILRQNGPLWSQIVIWTSVIGTFLTVTGLYVGVARFKKRRNGRWSPFFGWWYWHHMIGLVFGVLTLTWVFSGLMTMNPWGLLEGARSPIASHFRSASNWAETKSYLTAHAALPAAPELRQLRAAPFGKTLYVEAITPGAPPARLDAAAQPAQVREAEVRALVNRLGSPVKSFTRMEREDEYYYGHHDKPELPVYRAILNDAEQTRIYIGARDGALKRVLGKEARLSRWVRTGMHDLDIGWLRNPWVWYPVVGLLLLGVTAVCITGAWLSLQRVARDLKGLALLFPRPRRATELPTASRVDS